MKNARVSVIKNNIKKGDPIPTFKQDYEAGQWVEEQLIKNGHVVDRTGIIDLPEYNTDNKSRKKGSTANHTVGSMTINDILNTPAFKDTRYHTKLQNQNQVTYDTVFNEVSDVRLVDMDIDDIQDRLKEGYDDCRKQLIENEENGYYQKEIKSKNGWVVFDGYGHDNSYRMRIPNTAMKKIHNISGSRDTFKKLFV